MRTLICKINPQATLTCDCDDCRGCTPSACVIPCEGPERVEMFIVQRTRVTTEHGVIEYGPDGDDGAYFVSEGSGWQRIGEEAFYHVEEAVLQAEKNRRADIAYHEKALEELRRKNP